MQIKVIIISIVMTHYEDKCTKAHFEAKAIWNSEILVIEKAM